MYQYRKSLNSAPGPSVHFPPTYRFASGIVASNLTELEEPTEADQAILPPDTVPVQESSCGVL